MFGMLAAERTVLAQFELLGCIELAPVGNVILGFTDGAN